MFLLQGLGKLSNALQNQMSTVGTISSLYIPYHINWWMDPVTCCHYILAKKFSSGKTQANFLANPDAGKDWEQEEKGATEDEMVGWHHRLNAHEFEQFPGDNERLESLECCSPWGQEETSLSDWTTTRVQLYLAIILLPSQWDSKSKTLLTFSKESLLLLWSFV